MQQQYVTECADGHKDTSRVNLKLHVKKNMIGVLLFIVIVLFFILLPS